MSKRLFFGTGLGVLLFMLAGAGIVNAQSFRTGDNITISGQETIDQTLFAAGRNIDISAPVNGDIFCAGQNITINGNIQGDVICAGQTITVNGEVDGDIRLAGQSVTINAPVSSNASIAGQSVTIGSSGRIGQDLNLAADTATVNGRVARDIAGASSNLEINSRIGRGVTAAVDTLVLTDNARVGGDIEYTSDNELEQAEGAAVAGTITRNETARESRADYGSLIGLTAGFAVYIFLTALISALVLTAIFPQVFNKVSDAALERPLGTAGIGLVALIGVPVIVIGLMMTVLGIPLALMLLYVWLFIVFLSGVFSAYYLGRLLLRDTKNPLLVMLGGGTLLLLSYFVPVLGVLTMFAALVMGVGMILLALWRRTPRPSYTIT